MKKTQLAKFLPLICCILVLFTLSTGCWQKYPANRVIGVTQACYAIPGGHVCDMHASRTALIEKDEYGRWLISVRIENEYELDALCIVQRVDADYVYYYDNVNYVCIDGFQEYETYQVEMLKEANDWGKPLDETKMVKRELNDKTSLMPAMHYKNIRNEESSERIFTENVSIPDGYTYNVLICDWDATGKELYLASTTAPEDPPGVWRKHYLMVINRNGTYDPENFMVEFDDLYKSNQPLAEVKEKNGWQGKTGPMGDRLINNEEGMKEGDIFGSILAAAAVIIVLAVGLAGSIF
jgi:hypothetical protein